jgi:dienelactone hydrolase
LRGVGHIVHAPHLYDGRPFDDLREGVPYAEQVGFPEVIRRGTDAAKDLPADIVYAGFSLGVLPAQTLARTRPGARGALLFHACVSPSEFGTSWPEAVPLQIYMMDADEWTEVDRPVAEALVEQTPTAELFLYPGSGHLFADPSLSDYVQGGRRSAQGTHTRLPAPSWLDAVGRHVRDEGERESNEAERLSSGGQSLSSTIGICCQLCSR